MRAAVATGLMGLWLATSACGAPSRGDDDDGDDDDDAAGPDDAGDRDGDDGGPCAPSSLGQSYVGCDYWPTVTGNIVSQHYEFAVSVSNTSGARATVRIDGGALTEPMIFDVVSGGVAVRTLPWVEALKLCLGDSQFDCQTGHGTAARAVGGAYHLRSDVPVTVYQFNPLDFFQSDAPENSFSNDASLLFPTTSWRDDYYVASFTPVLGGIVAYPSLLAVTAHEDGTRVTINARASTAAQNGAPRFDTGVPQDVMLDAGDVIQIGAVAGDLTGSRVTSDKPIQVIGAHYCSRIPLEFGFCDHLEESMFPVETLSRQYVVVAPAVTTIPDGKEQYVRIVATAAATTLTYDPPIAGAPTTIASPGDFVEIARNPTSFLVTANHKVLVAQYMEGSQVAGNTGDPSMALAVPVEQYRTEYLFHAPLNYTTSYVDVIARTGTAVTLDGVLLTGFTPIGTSGYALARVTPLGPGTGGVGNHTITGSTPFGISVYGYGQDTSYWYPGGLDLRLIPID
ncbi:MAG TPA: IgGFc-binding protein [Kofleriaceae bacterium]|nr:IgGFc-binding protein [Kofleriaceae bacterium]